VDTTSYHTSCNILKKDSLGPVWVEAVEDLETATVLALELATLSPGEYHLP